MIRTNLSTRDSCIARSISQSGHLARVSWSIGRSVSQADRQSVHPSVSQIGSQLTSCSFMQSVSLSVSPLASQPASQSVNQTTSLPVSQSVSQPGSQSVGQSVSQPASQPVGHSVSPCVRQIGLNLSLSCLLVQTDIHLHCKEWDRMLEEENWEPEEIVAKLPIFLQFLRSVQNSVAPWNAACDRVARVETELFEINERFFNHY